MMVIGQTSLCRARGDSLVGQALVGPIIISNVICCIYINGITFCKQYIMIHKNSLDTVIVSCFYRDKQIYIARLPNPSFYRDKQIYIARLPNPSKGLVFNIANSICGRKLYTNTSPGSHLDVILSKNLFNLVEILLSHSALFLNSD